MRKIFLSEEQIKEICVRLGNQLDERFSKNTEAPVFVCVLKGAANFFINLISEIKTDIITDYIQVSSYKGTQSTGVIHMKKDFSEDLHNKDVVIVEDIIDTGLTLSYIKKYIEEKYQPKSVSFVCLVDKKAFRQTDLQVDYYGYETEGNDFLIGFGLDYNEHFRNVKYIYIPDDQEKEELKKIK